MPRNDFPAYSEVERIATEMTKVRPIRATYYPPVKQAHKMTLIERIRLALKRGA